MLRNSTNALDFSKPPGNLVPGTGKPVLDMGAGRMDKCCACPVVPFWL
jgi:hypothetical protein